jgi:hypothetical protein
MNNSQFSRSFLLKFLILLAYAAGFFFLIKETMDFGLFLLGVICGAGLLIGDELKFYQWYQEKNNDFLVTRSALFMLSLPPLAVVVLTSFGSFWASGLIGGMMLWLLLEMLELRLQPAKFMARFMQGAKLKTTPQTVRMILAISSIFFLLVHLLSIL